MDALRLVAPRRLYLVADGPRNVSDLAPCKETREIFDLIDWPCDVRRNFSACNLGCGVRVATGLDWVFRYESRAIILEDDCIPNLDFFRFCCQLLDRYDNSAQVMAIVGTNLQQGNRRSINSYHFGIYSVMWGWATWRRAWKKFELNPADCVEWNNKHQFRALFDTRLEADFWRDRLARLVDSKNPFAWDWQWLFAIWRSRGFIIIPEHNLISNLGTGRPDATHTVGISPFGGMQIESIEDPLVHPLAIERSKEADLYVLANALGGAGVVQDLNIANRLRRIVLRNAGRLRRFIKSPIITSRSFIARVLSSVQEKD
ncbi:MAG: glycosyltransferase family 2 protein [Candidatus Competibacteraceae bacterium]